jgi:hypothetical protein
MGCAGSIVELTVIGLAIRLTGQEPGGGIGRTADFLFDGHPESTMEREKLYDELGQTWRHFASWREKSFAGYLTVLTTLGIGFSQNANFAVRGAILAGGIVVSIAFWILDFRNHQCLNACQVAAASLEDSKGVYSALNNLRFATKRTWFTYGLAIDLLVSGVIGASFAGMLVYVVRLAKDLIGLLALSLAAAVACVIAWRLQALRGRRWLEAKEVTHSAIGARVGEKRAVEQANGADAPRGVD